MGKKKSFEELLESDFRWPAPGDRPFVVHDDPHKNANIAENGLTRLVLMIDGYKRAADLMVEESERDQRARDILVFPIIYNYRHFLELSLKHQLATFGPTVGIEANWRTHQLEKLWESFCTMSERYGTPDPDEAEPIVGEIVLEFAKIDPGSFSHRYPVDRNGTPVPLAVHDLHLPTLADVLEAVSAFFSGSDGFFDNLKNAGP